MYRYKLYGLFSLIILGIIVETIALFYVTVPYRQTRTLYTIIMEEKRQLVAGYERALKKTPEKITQFSYSEYSFFGNYGYLFDVVPNTILTEVQKNGVYTVCSQKFTGYPTENGVYKNKLGESLDNREIPPFVPTLNKQIKNETGSYLQTFEVCQVNPYTEDGQEPFTFVISSQPLGGGGGGSKYWVGHVENKIVTETAELPPNTIPYFSCGEKLGVTKDNILYLVCGGGDAGYSGQILYSIDLDAFTAKKVRMCEYTTELLEDGEKSETYCS